ncbi:hypothetical protein V500_06308 [Pseudogymnoascus sp. VKM F-4518 (FW-2643)]|nr:hypothetical protein V500_06308 [Pseudogymnoascus sp. VKM F-4518 (FW-2643)]
MAGKVILVRHGHALHNVDNDDRIPDPRLTLGGERQSVRLGQKIAPRGTNTIGIILTSPLIRSIHTTLLAFIDVLDERFYLKGEGGIPGGADLVLDPYLQEVDDAPCNTGSAVANLEEEWPKLDFSTLRDPWPLKKGIFSPNKHEERAQEVLGGLNIRLSNVRKDVVVVTHGGFMQDLTDDPHFSLELATMKACTIITKNNGELKLGK